VAHQYFVMRRPGERDRVLVWDTRTLSFGRARENDVVLDDSEVSRRHALFVKQGDRCEVGDRQTGNGTFVNGQRLAGTRELRSGDVVAIGSLRLEFCDSDEHPAKRGVKLEYASHFKTVGRMPRVADPGSTLLGLDDSLAGDDDEFVIERGERDGGVADLDLGLDTLEPARPREPLALALDDDLGLDRAGGPRAAEPRVAAPAAGDPIERMRRLKSLHAEGLISDAEFERKRAEILEEI
jgi:hypothetical protein